MRKKVTEFFQYQQLKVTVDTNLIQTDFVEEVPVACGQGMQVMRCMTNELLRDDLYFSTE